MTFRTYFYQSEGLTETWRILFKKVKWCNLWILCSNHLWFQ